MPAVSVLSERAVASSSSSRFSSSAALARASSRRTVTLSSPAGQIQCCPATGWPTAAATLASAGIEKQDLASGAAHLLHCPMKCCLAHMLCRAPSLLTPNHNANQLLGQCSLDTISCTPCTGLLTSTGHKGEQQRTHGKQLDWIGVEACSSGLKVDTWAFFSILTASMACCTRWKSATSSVPGMDVHPESLR